MAAAEAAVLLPEVIHTILLLPPTKFSGARTHGACVSAQTRTAVPLCSHHVGCRHHALLPAVGAALR